MYNAPLYSSKLLRRLIIKRSVGKDVQCYSFLYQLHFWKAVICPVNGLAYNKAIPLQAWTGPEGSSRLRLPD